MSIDYVCWYTQFLWMNSFWMNHSDSQSCSAGGLHKLLMLRASLLPEIFSMLTDWPFVPPRPSLSSPEFFCFVILFTIFFWKTMWACSVVDGVGSCAMMSVRFKNSPKASVLFCKVYVSDYNLAWLVRNCELLCLSGYFAVLRKCLNAKMSYILTVLTYCN